MDGIDAVLAVLDPVPSIIRARQHPWPLTTLERLREAATGIPQTASQLAQLDSAVGEAFANAALEVIGDYPGHILAIGSHGQTLAHGPDASPPFTLQIGNGAIIAERTGINAVSDFRSRDIAAGGQGAPLVPAFHAACLRDERERRIILNIGGIANVTLLPTDTAAPILGFDTGPGNCLLDAWFRKNRKGAYDNGGKFAAMGGVREDLLRSLLSDPYFDRPAPKSTGTDYFSLSWLEQRVSLADTGPEDVQATLVELTTHSIARAIREASPGCERVLVCGGGVHNPVIMQGLRQLIAAPVESTAVVGLDPDWIEALAFAWLARQTLQRLPGNLPEVTGASGPRILGALYPA